MNKTRDGQSTPLYGRNKIMKTAVLTVLGASLALGTMQPAMAGGWCVAGKVLTGVVAGSILVDALTPHTTTVVYAPAPPVVYAPAPQIVYTPAPVYYGRPCPPPPVYYVRPAYPVPPPVVVYPARRHHAVIYPGCY
jgi:hypothetical protein